MTLVIWKLIRYYWQKELELFNMATDPGERRNLATDEPEKLKALQTKLDRMLAETDARMPLKKSRAAQKTVGEVVIPDEYLCFGILISMNHSARMILATRPGKLLS